MTVCESSQKAASHMKSIPTLTELFDRHRSGTKTAPEVVVALIREAIVTGALGSGMTIKQDEIARICNTSKAPVREALKGLEVEGLTQSIRNRGFIVTRMSGHEMWEIFRTRAVLEPLAIELAMPMITERDIAKAETYIEKMESLSYSDASWTCALNMQFHLAIYEPSRTLHLLNMIRHAHYVSHRYVHAAYWVKDALPRSQEQHREIIDACRARNTAWAKTLLKNHMYDALEQLKRDLGDFLASSSSDDELEAEMAH